MRSSLVFIVLFVISVGYVKAESVYSQGEVLVDILQCGKLRSRLQLADNAKELKIRLKRSFNGTLLTGVRNETKREFVSVRFDNPVVALIAVADFRYTIFDHLCALNMVFRHTDSSLGTQEISLYGLGEDTEQALIALKNKFEQLGLDLLPSEDMAL